MLPLTGGNIDTPILGRVLERGLASDGRLYRFTATISDRPGGLAGLAKLIAETGASVTEITHDRAFAGEDITTVNVHCIVETRDQDHITELRDRLQREGFLARLLQPALNELMPRLPAKRAGEPFDGLCATGGCPLAKSAQQSPTKRSRFSVSPTRCKVCPNGRSTQRLDL